MLSLFLKVNICLQLLQITQVTSHAALLDTRAVRKTEFEDGQKGKRLDFENSLLKKLKVSSTASCGSFCSKHKTCRSFNLCAQKRCELNRYDIFSTPLGTAVLNNVANCKYFGMRKQSYPSCLDKNELKKIRDDQNPGACQINLKRVDFEWSGWDIIQYDNASDWRDTWTRETLVESAHGGLPRSGASEKLWWLKFVLVQKTWTEARDNCFSMGGKLFFNVDGTSDQLQTLYDKMGGQVAWVGMYTEDHITWNNSAGEILNTDLFIWRSGEPNNDGGDEYHLVLGYGGAVLNDMSQTLRFASICDMV